MAMAVLKPKPSRKRGREEIPETCILCNEECDEDRSNLSLDAWERMKVKAQEWKGLRKFGTIYDSVDWEAGPKGVFFHKRCRAALAVQRGLQQAKRHQEAEQKQVTQETQTQDTQQSEPSVARCSRSKGLIHDKNLCVWCMKPQDRKNSNPLCIIQQWNAWNTFKSHTVYLQDTQMRDRIATLIDTTPDPFATEIRYHRSCWKKHTKPCYNSSLDDNQIHLQEVRLTEVQQMFFKHVCTVVLEMNEPRTLQGLLLDYNQMRKNFCFASVTQTSIVKKMLQKEFKDKIGFHDRFHKNQSTIVYDTSAGGSYIEAAIYSWGISDEQLINNVARLLKEKLSGESDRSWPPHVVEFENVEEPHILLRKLLTWLKDPAIQDFTEACNDPRITTLSSLLLSFITGNRTSLQASLSVTLHGLTRSREITDILKKLGLGISYRDVLALYESWAMHDIKANSTCPDTLADGFPGTGILDNDDFQDDTLTGADTSHRTNVMFVQPDDVAAIDSREDHSPLQLVKSDDLKNTSTEQHKIHPYKTVKRGQPALRKEIDISLQTSNEQRKRGVMHALTRIDMAGNDIPAAKQKVGSFAGFQANIHKRTKKSSAHYFLTFPKPPQKSVVHEVMCRMVAAAEAKSMPFIQLVGDQPVYALMVQLKNENRDKFQLIVPVLGPFHTHISFISAINKRFQGSGLSEILVAADIISEGSVDQALRGKHYNRSIRCLTLMYEVLMRRIIRQGFISKGLELSSELKDKLEVLRNPSTSTQEQLQAISADLQMDAEFSSFIERAFESVEKSDSPMARLWLSFMEMVEILIMNIHALRTQDWDEFKASLRMMMPWLRIYDNDKYSKWLVEFWLEISSLPDEKEKYMREGLFAQSMTGKPYSCLPLDLWIEMTMNKGSKMKAGWKSILKNEKMLFTHTRTVDSVNRVRSSLHELANIKDSSKGHKENSTKRLLHDEHGIQDLDKCLSEFECDPFDETRPTLRSLQSGMVASNQLVHDFDTAHKDGESLVQSFFKERMFSNVKNFDDTIHRNSRHSFSKPPISKDPSQTKVEKTDAMENKAMAQVISLAQKCGCTFELSDVMQYRVTDECLPIFNVNGTMRKGMKSKLVDKLKLVEVDSLDSYIAVVDMGFIWRLSTPSCEDREKQDGKKFTWGDYANKAFNLVLARHPKSSKIFFVNDPYDLDVSIKDTEHLRRTGLSFVGGTRNVFMKRDDELPTSKHFNNMFKNPGNKIRLQQFLKTEFKTFSLQHPEKSFIYSVRDHCWDLKNDVEMEEFTCQHMEADTILLYIYSQLRKSGVEDAVVIDAEDTDVMVLAAYVAHQIKGTLCIKRKRVIYDCKTLCRSDVADVIVPFHIHTGADAVSSFYGHGKPSIFDTAMKSEEARKLLQGLGKRLPVTADIQDDMEQFTIRYIYKDKTSKRLAEARAKKWEEMKKKSTLRIPPDSDSHNMKVTRANYQVFILLNFMNPDAPPSPLQHGWCLREGKCAPIRYTQPALPKYLSNFTVTAAGSTQEYDTHSDTSDYDEEPDSNESDNE